MEVVHKQTKMQSILAVLKIRFLYSLGMVPSMLRSEEEVLLARADVRVRRRLAFLQSLPMWIMMLIPLGIFIFSENKALLMVMMLAVLTIYTPLISLLGVCVAVKTGSHGANVSREYSRLAQIRREGKITANAKSYKLSIADRAFERRFRRPRKAVVPGPRTGRAKYAR